MPQADSDRTPYSNDLEQHASILHHFSESDDECDEGCDDNSEKIELFEGDFKYVILAARKLKHFFYFFNVISSILIVS